VSVAGKLCEMSDILTHRHGSLPQILEPLLLELDNGLRYMVRAESHLKLIPADGVYWDHGTEGCLTPNTENI
jgi:hypothetical protein